MRIVTLFVVMVAAVLLVSCGQQVASSNPASSGASDSISARAPDQAIQADIAWEKLDLGAVDFDSLTIESLDAELDLIEASLD